MVVIGGPPNKINPTLLQVSKSICKIAYDNGFGTGFLIKFKTIDKNFFFLMTCGYIIQKDMINQRKKITFNYDNENRMKEIDLFPEQRYIKDFRDFNLDVILVEILPEDNIPEDYFLLSSTDYEHNINSLLNKDIMILQYYQGELSYSFGSIKEIYENEFTHLASTGPGSGGSPIFLKDSSKVIGMHKCGGHTKKVNYGDSIDIIFDYFINSTDEMKKNSNKKSNDENKIFINNFVGNNDIDKMKEENINLKKENKELKEIISRYPFKLSEKEYILSLIIITKDEKVVSSIICKNTDKFSKVEENFYKEYPEYLENKGTFSINNDLIQKDKTLEELKLKNNNIIIFEELKANEIKNEIKLSNHKDHKQDKNQKKNDIKRKKK